MPASPPDKPRRGPLVTRRRVLGCCAGALAAGALDAAAIEPRWLDVARYDVAIAGLAAGLDGLRIAHLSDLHLDALGWVHESIARELRAFDPALVFVTGDTIEEETRLGALEALVALVGESGGTVLATPGNWEHWGRVPMSALRAAYARAGATLLANETTVVEGLRILAIDDGCSGHADPGCALRDLDGRPRVILTHAPGLFDELPRETPDFALAVAGHTHGGQLCPAGVAVWTPPGSGAFVAGRYDTAHGPLLVSRGVGMSLLGARHMCRPEISLVTLKR